MRLQVLFIVVVTGYVSIYLSSCSNCSSKTVNCAAFNDTSLNSWFPYKTRDTLLYVSNTGDRDTFTLLNIFTSAPYDEQVGGYSRHSDCYAEKNFKSLEGDSSASYMDVSLHVSASVFNDTTTKWANVRMKKSYILFSNLRDTEFSYVTIANQNAIINRLSSVTLGGKTFSNVISAYIDTTNGKINGIYKIYYGRNQGIIAYETYPSLKTWVKQ